MSNIERIYIYNRFIITSQNVDTYLSYLVLIALSMNKKLTIDCGLLKGSSNFVTDRLEIGIETYWI